MKTWRTVVLATAMLAAAGSAHALCGDVNADDKKTAADALAVLRSAVGQAVNLVCTDTTPSRIRFYNDIDCSSGSDTSQARFHDTDENYTFNANPDQTTSYQTVDETQIDDIKIDLCGTTYSFDSPFHLAAGHSYTLYMVLVDPAIYGQGYAYSILYDTGEAAPAAAISELAAEAESDWILGTRE